MLIEPSWLSEATMLPLAFALVREDPVLDLAVLRSVKPTASRIAMVASGGCTAAHLAGHIDYLHLIDPNPAQLALTRLKLHLLQTATATERLELLGHLPLPTEDRHKRLLAAFDTLDLAHDCFGPIEPVANLGPDFAGRYERLFVQLQKRLEHKTEWEHLLCLEDPAVQAQLVAPNTALGQNLDAVYDEVFCQSNLAHLFGEEATRNRVEPFARHFAQRTRQVLASRPAKSNPYLWLMLQGRLPNKVSLPWLSKPALVTLPQIEYSQGMLGATLDAAPGSYDFIHLSNILDWLPDDAACQTLESAWRALRPGGVVLVRQLNSTLDITKLGAGFVWDLPGAHDLLQRDRSFFYRAIHLGKKP